MKEDEDGQDGGSGGMVDMKKLDGKFEEAASIVGHQDGAKRREVLVKDFSELQPILDPYMKK